MKKILSFVLCLGLVAASFASCSTREYNPEDELSEVSGPSYVAPEAAEYVVPEEQLVYECALDYSTGSAIDVLKITGYTGEETELVIPDRLVHPDYGNLPVVAIAESAFINNETIEKVTIPWSVSVIGTGAFQNCTNLKEVKIFEGETAKLTKVTEQLAAPKNVTVTDETKIEDLVGNAVNVAYYEGETVSFAKVYEIGETIPEEIYVPAQLKEIKDNAFVGSGLETINIPETVTTLGNHVFSTILNNTPWYDSLTDEFEIIGDGILIKYNNVNGASEVVIGEEVKDIAYYAFVEDFEPLAEGEEPLSVVLPDTLESISRFAVFSLDGKYSQIIFKVNYGTPAVEAVDATAYNYEVLGAPEEVAEPVEGEEAAEGETAEGEEAAEGETAEGETEAASEEEAAVEETAEAETEEAAE